MYLFGMTTYYQEPNGWHIVSIILGLMGMGWLALMEEHLKECCTRNFCIIADTFT
jgi:hypothetical protein